MSENNWLEQDEKTVVNSKPPSHPITEHTTARDTEPPSGCWAEPSALEILSDLCQEIQSLSMLEASDPEFREVAITVSVTLMKKLSASDPNIMLEFMRALQQVE